MISKGQIISFRNVISKVYHVYAEEVNLAMEDMSKLMEDRNLHASGPFFYTVFTGMNEDPMVIKMFVPIEENQLPNLQDKELEFSSYFLMTDMLALRIDDDYTVKTIEGQMELIDYAVANDMEIASTFFYMLKEVEEKLYMEIYLKADF